VQMKNGFTIRAQNNTMGGSFGRIQSSAQYGKQIDNWSVYGALKGVRDNGYRNFSESAIRRFYGDVGYRTDSTSFTSRRRCQEQFWASAPFRRTAPKYWGATIRRPDHG